VFGIQRQAKVEQKPLPVLFNLDTTAADLMTTSMDANAHRDLPRKSVLAGRRPTEKLTGAAHQTPGKIKQTVFRVRLNAGLCVTSQIEYMISYSLAKRGQPASADTYGK
jgi:hypothetical protein